MRPRVPVHRLSTWLLLAVALAGAAAFLVVRVALPSDGARIAFYGDGWSTTGIRIDPIDDPAPGLRAGDVVVAIDGVPLEHWLGGGGGRPPVGEPVAGRPVAYALVRDGVATTAAVTWTAPPAGETLLAGWSIAVLSLATAGLAVFVFRRRPGLAAGTALMVAAAAIAGSSLPWFLGTTISDLVSGPPFVLHALLTGPLYMLLWPAGLHLALVLPAPAPSVIRRRWLVPAVYATSLGAYGLGMLAAGVAGPAGATRLEWIGRWPAVQLLVVAPTVLLTIVVLALRYRRVAEPMARARLRLVTLSAIGSATLGLVLFEGPELLLGHSLVPAEWIGLVALPLPVGIAVAILRDQLFEIEIAVNRALVYGGLTIGVLASYLVAVYAITVVVGGQPGFAGQLIATGLAALIAIPLRDLLQRAANRALYGSRGEPLRAMRNLGARLEMAADPERAFPAVAESVADSLRLPYVGLEVLDEVGRATMVAEHGSAPAIVETLPLVHGAEPVGRLRLGVRSGERGFGPAELALLRDLARQAGAAVHAQRLRDDLARSRERLIVAREEERRRLRRDLHDGLGPTLAAIGMRAEAAAAVLDRDPVAGRHQLESLAADVGVAIADVRRLIDGLRPPALDELGLLGALGQQAARLDGTGSVSIRLEGEPTPMPDLPAAVEVAAYRIAVEAMTNAIRHAGAGLCRVRLVAATQLTIEVTDDGSGPPATLRPGTGLESMRERAGELGGEVAIEPRPGGGTRVVARLPLDPQAAT